MFKAYNHPRKHLYSDILTSVVNTVEPSKNVDQKKLESTSTCIEAIVLGSFLFENMNDGRDLFSSDVVAYIMSSKLTGKNFILSGDFFYGAA